MAYNISIYMYCKTIIIKTDHYQILDVAYTVAKLYDDDKYDKY